MTDSRHQQIQDRVERVLSGPWKTVTLNVSDLKYLLNRVRELEAELSAVRQTLQELDEMADRYATSHGGYCGNTKGVLLSLLHPSRNSHEG